MNTKDNACLSYNFICLVRLNSQTKTGAEGLESGAVQDTMQKSLNHKIQIVATIYIFHVQLSNHTDKELAFYTSREVTIH